MKKLVSMLIILCMSLILGACGGGAQVDADETVSESGEKIWKVAVLLPYIGDQSYYDAVEAGRKELDARDDVEATLIEIGLDQAQWESYFMDACESGYDLIVSGYADVEPTLYGVAEMYPDQLFFNFDYSNHVDLDNVYAVSYSSSELGYIAGTLSSLVTTSDMEKANADNKVGVVVGEDNDYMNDFIGSFCEVCTQMGTKVYISYPNTFEDPAKGKEQALAMYNEGVDIIWQVAGGTGLGVFEAAADADKYTIGVDSDQAASFAGQPQLAQTILTSMYKDCGSALIYAVEDLVNGEYPAGTTRTMGVAEGTLGLVENDQYLEMVPEDIRTQVSEAIEKLVNGEVEVYSVAADPDRWEEVKAAAMQE